MLMVFEALGVTGLLGCALSLRVRRGLVRVLVVLGA